MINKETYNIRKPCLETNVGAVVPWSCGDAVSLGSAGRAIVALRGRTRLVVVIGGILGQAAGMSQHVTI